MDTKLTTTTTTVTLPTALTEALADLARSDGRTEADIIRTALEIYVERCNADTVVNGTGQAAPPSAVEHAASSDDAFAAIEAAAKRRFSSVGIGESTVDDGYDSSNIKDWLRKTWRPDQRWTTE